MRHRQADTRYLELHRGKYRVTLATPRPLHGQLGSRLKRPLNTASLSTANALKWQIVAELRTIIDRAAQGNPTADQPANEALSIAAHRATLRDPEAVRELDEEIILTTGKRPLPPAVLVRPPARGLHDDSGGTWSDRKSVV